MSKESGDKGRYRDETLLSVLGRDPAANHGVVNPPVYHASTILHETAAALKEATFGPREYGKTYYGRYGTPTTFPLQDSIAALEQGHRTYLFGSGKAAIVAALLAFVKSGDHVLMTDSAYGPTRSLANGLLKRMGVETTFYDPCIGAGLADLMQGNTSVVVGESPGSLTFEIQDFPALAAVAHERGAVLIVDNTWASPLFCQPLALGADVSIQACTKYIVGHSDAMLGSVTTTEAQVEPVRRIFEELGAAPGPDDCYLGLRGLRTLSVRLHRHQETGLALARWFQARPEVRRVLHPALEDDPGHALWKRDFSGASSLFGVVLEPVPEPAVDAFLDSLGLFGLGYSWGGYESLALPTYPWKLRDATRWDLAYPLLRIYAGLEDPDDLIADLERGFEQMAAVRDAD
ncbi:MAG: cystathionine beta-lyase [Rhodospirillaceae bacterium]|nr:cystathionine beta-lyase [Rhodospirillaceae bacterium]